MDLSTNVPTRYDTRTIVLHWLTAALVAALWLLGETIDWFPKGDARVAARSTHILLGVTLALVLTARVTWRFGGAGVHIPLVDATRMDALAAFVHKALYALLVCTVLLGLLNAWQRGDTVFNLFTIRSLFPDNKAFRETIEELHGLSANALLIVAALHAAAGLLHHYVLKDDVLRRMLARR